MTSRVQLRQFGDEPWKQAIIAMVRRRVSSRHSERIIAKLLRQWPGPEYLCRASCDDVTVAIWPLLSNRANQLIRFSSMWLGDGWEDLSELPGMTHTVIRSMHAQEATR